MPFSQLRSLLLSAISAYEPSHVRVVLIRRWFGPRWLGFAGKLMGVAGVRTTLSVVPPFNPRRVVGEFDLRLPPGIAAGYELHGWRSSEENTRRYMTGLGSNGTLAAWLSIPDAHDDHHDCDEDHDQPVSGGRTHGDNKRACLMVHFIAASPKGTLVDSVRWYAQCIQTDALTIEPNGISLDELRWMQSHAPADDVARHHLMQHAS